jgi:hypothetical protein
MNRKQIHSWTLSALGTLVAAVLLVAAYMPGPGASRSALSTTSGVAASVLADLVGVGLHARSESDARTLRGDTDNRHPNYSLATNSYLQKAKLTASQRSADDGFGWSVAISGNTVVVAAWMDDVGDNEWQGSAYIFVRPAAGWTDMTPVAKLTASDGAANDLFGASVAIDGETVVVGAADAAYVFVKPAGGWKDMTETAKLIASDGQDGDGFGRSVAVSGDTVVVGAYNHDLGGPLYDQGLAYVFVKPAGGWKDMTETATPSASDPRGYCRFGYSVAISGDTAVIGAHQCVAAYVFVKPGGGWMDMNETAKLDSSSTLYDYFGYSVAISGDVVLVGTPWDDVGDNSQQGSAYIFVKPASGWVSTTETAILTASDGGVEDRLGESVAISGHTAVVSAAGAAYIFAEPDGGWAGELHEQARVTGSGVLGSVAVSGEVVVSAAPDEDAGEGAAFVFERGYAVYLPLVTRNH